MILRFRTKPNTCGYYKYLIIDTDTRTYSRNNPYITANNAITIRSTDYKTMLDNLHSSDFIEKQFIK